MPPISARETRLCVFRFAREGAQFPDDVPTGVPEPMWALKSLHTIRMAVGDGLFSTCSSLFQ
eukprot:1714411-Heterocapsa_arctica.AAC.1